MLRFVFVEKIYFADMAGGGASGFQVPAVAEIFQKGGSVQEVDFEEIDLYEN